MAITLVDLAKKAKTPFEAGVMKQFLHSFEPAKDLPVVTKGSLKAQWTQELSLPTVETRNLNAEWTDYTTGHDEELAISLPIYGGILQIDKQMLSEPGGAEVWSDQVEKKTRAMGYRLASDFLVGDTASNPSAMDGLKVWRTRFPSRYTVDAGNLDLNTAADRTTNARQLIMYMKEAMLRIEEATGEMASLIIMNFTMYTFLADAFIASGYYKTTMDAQDRMVERWMGARIVRMGYGAPTGAGQTTQSELLTNSHDSANNTSMYFLRAGEQYCHLLQKHSLKVSQQFETDGGVFLRKTVEWPVVFRAKTIGCMASIKNLLVA